MSILKKSLVLFCKKYFSIIAISVLVCVFFWKVFLQGLIPFPGDFVVGIYYPWLDYKWGTESGVPVKNPIMADVPSFMYPMQTFAMNTFKLGVWPLWNPLILSGIPLLANFQSAPLSILNIFYLFFSDHMSWTFQIITSHILVAFFCYILLRKWKLSKASSILGGLIFTFSGFNLIWSQWNGHVLTASFFPLIIYFIVDFFEKSNRRSLVGLSLALALQIMSGYPQLILYTGLLVFIICLFHFSLTKKYFFKTFAIGLFLLFGFGLSGIQLLPGYELLKLSQWSAEPHPQEWAFLPLEKTITFIAPDYFGNHATYNYWGKQDYTSNTGFIGSLALILSLIALVRWKSKPILIASTIAALSLVLSYQTPLSQFLWTNNILGMKSSSAHRVLILFNLAGAILAGFGFELLKQKHKFVRSYLYSFMIVGFLLSLFGIHSVQIKNTVAFRNLILPSFIFGSSFLLFILRYKFSNLRNFFLVGIFFLLIFEIFRFGWKFTSFSKKEYIFPDTPVTQFLKNQEGIFRISNGDTMPVNFQMYYGFETLGGYETMRPLLSSQFIATLNNNTSLANPSGRYGIIDNDTSHLLDLVNTKYYLTLKKDEKGQPSPNGRIPSKFSKERFKVSFEDKSTAIMESLGYLNRAFIVYDWDIVSDERLILDKLVDPKFPISKKIILEEDPGIKKSNNVDNFINFVGSSSNESNISVSTEKDGLLFLSETFFPGWEAFVDGQQTKIFKANYAFRAIVVPSGNHLINFKYNPKSFRDGLFLTKLSGLLLAIIFVSSYTSLNVKKFKK